MANHKSSTPGSPSAPGSAVSVVGAAAGPVASKTNPSVPVLTGGNGSGTQTGLGLTGLGPQGLPNLFANGFEGKVEKMLAGVQSQLPAGTVVSFFGQTYSVAQVVQVLQTVAGLYTALDTLKKQSKTALTQARQGLAVELPSARQFYSGLVSWLRTQFGVGNPVLANFGIPTGARKKAKAATKAAAVATAANTRVARNTMGKKQKLKVKGAKATIVAVGPDGQAVSGASPSPAAPTGGSGK